MRKRFEQQLTIGRLLIKDTEITTAKRAGSLPGLCATLKEIFITPQWNQKVPQRDSLGSLDRPSLRTDPPI